MTATEPKPTKQIARKVLAVVDAAAARDAARAAASDAGFVRCGRWSEVTPNHEG